MPPIAPLVAGWERRLSGQPGPFSAPAGSGESPSGASVQVELLIDGLWTDITSYVMTRDGSYNVAISTGQPNEGNRTDPAHCTFQLNNRDGRFSPRNPTSPYYGKIGRNQPLRVSVQSGLDKAYRFWGEVSAWPPKWDTTGTDVWVDLEASGILRRLGQGQQPLGSTMRIALSGPTTVGANSGQANPVVAYWPCEDASGATSIASALGGPAMVITGAPTLSSFTGFVCSDPLPVMGTTGVFTGQVPTYTTPVSTMVRFLLAVPSAGASNNTPICTFMGTGTIKRWEVYYLTGSGGRVFLRGKDSTGAVVADTGTFGSSTATDGTLLQVSAELTQNGTEVDVTLWTMLVGDTSAVGSTATATSNTVGIVTSIGIGGAVAATAIGHLRLQTCSTSPQDIFDLLPQMQAYAGETAGTRIQRLCATAGVTFESIGSLSSTAAMGVQSNSTLMDLIDEALLADGGMLYELTDGLGLGYRTRMSLENQTSALALSYSGFNLSEVPTPVDDDQFTRNDITVTRTGGSFARATQKDGPLSVLPPPAGVGTYPDAVTVNVQADSQLADQAGWRLHKGTVDEARYPTIAVNLAHPTFANSSTLARQALALRPGDRLTISGMPSAFLPPDDVSQIVLGSSETIDNFQHRIRWNCQPESPYRVAITDSADFGRADTDGSTLAADVTSTGTTLSVATTTSGSPTWITDLSETPFDVRIAGEQITVAAVGTLLNGNPFFTVDLTGWSAQNSNISRDTGIINSARDAVASMLIVPNGSSASGGAQSSLTGVGTVTPAATYVVGMWAYSPAGWSDLRPCVDWYDAAGVFLSSGLGPSGTAVVAGTWTWITQTLTAPASASQLAMRVRHGGTPAATDIWYAWAPRAVPSASVVSTSPQAMTAIRSVNGVVKPQLTGADVRLNQPAIAAL